MTAEQLRRHAIYGVIEARRRRDDDAADRMRTSRPNDPARDARERVDHLKGLVGQLDGSSKPEFFLAAIAAQAVAWLEAVDETQTVRVDTGREEAA